MHTQREPDQKGSSDRRARSVRTAVTPPAVQRALAVRAPITAAQARALQGLAGNAAVVQRLAQDQERQQGHNTGCGDGCGHTPSVQRSAVSDVISTPGQRFDGPMRKEAESVYGVDLSHLRTHTDATARLSAQGIGAEAYTSGNHMVFDGAMTHSKVLHEVAHTFQQAAGQVSGNDNGDGLKVSDPNSPEERQAAAMENAGAPTAGIQRLISPAAAPTPEVAPAAEESVQRMARRSSRSSTQRDSERRANEDAPRTHARSRAGAAASGSGSGQRDPLTEAARVPLPRLGPNGEPLWSGTRTQLTWLPGTEEAVLERTHSRESSRTGTNRYECQHCGDMVLSRAAAASARERNWYEIDHIEGILAYVHRVVDPIEWVVEVGHNIDRDVTAITLESAREAASHLNNLRVLCRSCNGGSRAANSESRHMDRNGPQWTSLPYYREVAAPAETYDAPPPTGGYYDPSGGQGGYGGYGGGYGGQSSADPGYNVVDVAPRYPY